MSRRIAALVLILLATACSRDTARAPLAPSPNASAATMPALPGGSISWQSATTSSVSFPADHHLPGPSAFAVQVSGSTVTLGWQVAAGNVSQYVIEAGSGTGLANLAVFGTGAPTPTATVTNVPTGIYFVRIRAVVDGALTAASNEVVVSVGGACLATVSPQSSHVPRAGGTITIAVTSACAWTVTNHSPGFISVVAGSSGSGNGLVVLAVPSNAGAARTGSVNIGGNVVTVSQDSGALHVAFEMFDFSTQTGATTECRINANPSRCVLRSTSFTFGPTAIASYAWVIQYTYGGEVRTRSQTSSSPEFAFTEQCGLLSSDASGALQPLSVSLTITDTAGNTAQAIAGTFNQPALNLRLYSCP